MLFTTDGQKEQGIEEEEEAKEGNRYTNNTRMRVCCLPCVDMRHMAAMQRQ